MAHYETVKEEGRFWITEKSFSEQFELKTESIFSQCNGYMGIRAVQPFSIIREEKGLFVCGLFNRAYKDEVTELVNCPDLTWFSLRVNGIDICPEKTKRKHFCRKLDVLSGEIVIQYEFEIPGGVKFGIENRRFAAMHEKHMFFQKLMIIPISGKIQNISIQTGIDARMTNHGVSHFQNVNCRVYDKHMMEVSGILEDGCLTVLAENKVRNAKIKKKVYTLERRSIFETIDIAIEAEGQKEIVLEKTAYISNTDSLMLDDRKEILTKAIENGYSKHFEKHKVVTETFWKSASIHIEGISEEEEAAICFAQYHLMGMTPWHSNECSIAAKGLTGEGYKGHVFWDTEIFIFPFLAFTAPQVARNLLEYRYHGLDHARKKAESHNFRGAMFPWESALSGEEETPLYASLNIHTGKANKVWSGVKEYHVTADIIYAVNQYFEVTQDKQFMEQCGYEMIFEAAEFWTSCATWDEESSTCGFLDVIGPDEYTEHVDNNAYTNYMASFCVSLACAFYQKLKTDQDSIFEDLNRQLELEKRIHNWEKFLKSIYLPQPNGDGIIPQDDTFLSKPLLKNIEKYKQSQKKQLILTDYSRSEVVNMQVLKQADVVMLLNLFPQMLSKELTKKNVIFYEQRTIHDSSLSYCAHAQACSGIGAVELAKRFFQECLTVDLNNNPFDSTDGIHAASLGGIWNCLILGFAGVKYEKHILYIDPHLPEKWKKIKFRLTIESVVFRFEISNSSIMVQSEEFMEHPMVVKFWGKTYTLTQRIQIQKDAYIFDLDGVVVDTAKYHYLAWKKLAEELGFHFDIKHNERLKGVSRMESLNIVLETGNMQDLTEERKMELAKRKNNYYLQLIEQIDESEILPGIPEFLNKLRKKGYKIALGSASKSGKMILEKLKLSHQFDQIVDGNIVQNPKPNPEVFLTAARLMNAAPSNCTVVEDARAGIEAAHAGGMFCIGIGDKAVLAQADIVMEDTAQLDTISI